MVERIELYALQRNGRVQEERGDGKMSYPATLTEHMETHKITIDGVDYVPIAEIEQWDKYIAENGCYGCKWDYGMSSHCKGCKRICYDHYEKMQR